MYIHLSLYLSLSLLYIYIYSYVYVHTARRLHMPNGMCRGTCKSRHAASIL